MSEVWGRKWPYVIIYRATYAKTPRPTSFSEHHEHVARYVALCSSRAPRVHPITTNVLRRFVSGLEEGTLSQSLRIQLLHTERGWTYKRREVWWSSCSIEHCLPELDKAAEYGRDDAVENCLNLLEQVAFAYTCNSIAPRHGDAYILALRDLLGIDDDDCE